MSPTSPTSAIPPQPNGNLQPNAVGKARKSVAYQQGDLHLKQQQQQQQQPQPNIYTDCQDFLVPDFDANEYAKSSIRKKNPAGSAARDSDGSEGTLGVSAATYAGGADEIAASLARLSFSIDNLNKQIQAQVVSHHDDLLRQVSGIRNLENVLAIVRQGVESLNVSLDRLRAKIRVPYNQILMYTQKLDRLHAASEILRHLIRFLHLARRLELHLPGGERELAKAALTLKDLDGVLSEADLTGIEAIQTEFQAIATARTCVISEAGRLLRQGMTKQSQSDIASGLQIYHCLGQMQSRVQDILQELVITVHERMRETFDVQALRKQISDTGPAVTGPVKRQGEPNGGAAGVQWSVAIWSRIESLMELMADHCIQVYLLDRVLSLKRDQVTMVSFLEEVTQKMDVGFIQYFWKSLSTNFDRELREATKNSLFLQQTFQAGYPRLLRLIHELFARVAVHGGPSLDAETQSPEAVLMLRSIAGLETAYLARSVSRLFDPVNLAFPPPSGNHHTAATKSDVANVLRTIAAELDVVRFDQRLLRSVAKNVSKAIGMWAIKTESIIATDSTARQFPSFGATASQILNVDLINALYALHGELANMLNEFPPVVAEVVSESLRTTQRLMMGIIEPLLIMMTEELENTIMKIHREGLSKQIQKGGRQMQPDDQGSQYIVELSSKMAKVRTELLSRLQCGEEGKGWTLMVASRVLEMFLRHASMVAPLNESGKLKLTSDMAQLELAVTEFLKGTAINAVDLGACWRALRAFRPLLFLDLSQVTASHHISPLPTVIVLHHLFVRGFPEMQLPTRRNDWSEVEYSDWLDSHSEREALELLAGCARAYMQEVDRKGGKEYVPELPLVRGVLKNAGIV